MASYKKYVMIGVTTILLPLGTWLLQKVTRKFTEKTEQDSDAEASRNSPRFGVSLRGEHDNYGKRE